MSALDGWIDVCRTGTWRTMAGEAVAVDAARLDRIAAAYAAGDPAPVVVGHPDTNAPAYGWVEGLRRAGDRLQARLRDLAPAFRSAVEAGRYAGRSIKFNGDRLVHIGFLGGVAPAVDGLAPTQFADDGAGQQFAFATDAGGALADGVSWHWIGWRSVLGIVRGLRERIVEAEGVEAADRAIPEYEIDGIERAAREAEEAAQGARFAAPGAADPITDTDTEPSQQEDDPVSGANDIAADLAAARTELDGREAEVAAREAALAAAERLQAAEAAIGPHVEAGRVLPGERARLAALLTALPQGDDAAISFASADGEVRETPAAAFEAFLAGLPRRVEYAARAGGPAPEQDRIEDSEAIAGEAQILLAQARDAGTTLTAADAVAQVRAKRGLPV